MEIPITIATVVAVRSGLPDTHSPRPDGVQTFVFFGVPTSADYDMVNECFSDMAIDRGVDIAFVDEELDTGSYGNECFIEYPNGSISMLWEQRL